MPRAASVAARAAAPARTAPARRKAARPATARAHGASARTAAAPRRAIRVVPRGGARPAAAALGAGVLDRLLRGRIWIACIATLLAGVVFLNVSLLEMNRGITQDAERAAELRRDNAELRLRVAELASSERIQAAAAARGFVLPAPGDVHYLERRRGDGRRAAALITEPSGTPSPAPQPQSALPQGQARSQAQAQPQTQAQPQAQTQAPATAQPQQQATPPAQTQAQPLAGAGGAEAQVVETP